ncbi:kinase-like protein [Metschnikowia bicuspidata var. bicuspidata NRRL YB-4993]|uniref:EKC/KEOPS complex subunit BUD32 n=1 Tax=Metschnikowia bicuspidata var. bicuspidata NRRL YB-4993 TaxID=869754 RepID=A0A1A0H5Q6_9ASCO|nr:kinase-like protein [Metschnikowia bicuspidata var. bicuspidata NRRL YB-4993]OBA19366.1 kinase-like protein [Metschnikowia bicuspidata var. bicuspidata NRRL YB-4993]
MTDVILAQVQQAVPHIPMTVVSQGAEALVLSSTSHPYLDAKGKYIIKFRPKKPYRHPKIDALITKSRTVGEAKFMLKLNKLGVPAPHLILLDATNGVIWMNSVGDVLDDGSVSSLKNFLWYLEKNNGECLGSEAESYCRSTGSVIGMLHMHDMIHGDLTTSNIILQGDKSYLIDFGLSSYSNLPEDKAVDLYVLERAVLSTHSDYSDTYNKWLLEGYESAFSKSNKGKLKDTMKKLEDVRLRGRKRSMLG